MALRGMGPSIHGESANAWLLRSKRYLETPVAQGGMGLSAEKIADIEKRLKKAGGAFAEDPGKPKVTGKVATLDFTKPDAPEEITLDGLPDGKLGVHYFVLIETTGGHEPVAIEAIELPPGLEIDLQGILKGQPVKAGKNVLKIKLTDRLGESAEAVFEFNVEAEPEDEKTKAEATEAKPPAKRRLLDIAPPSTVQSLALAAGLQPATTDEDDEGEGKTEDKPPADTGETGKPDDVNAQPDAPSVDKEPDANAAQATDEKPPADDGQPI